MDVLFGLTLPTVISKKFKVCKDELCVIPEFPIKYSLTNLSWNVDFAVLSKKPERTFLVELKTDDNSIDKKQLWKMRNLVPSFAHTVEDITKIAETSKQKRKYEHLMNELVRADAMDKQQRNRYVASQKYTAAPTLVLICPNRAKQKKFCCIDFDEYAGLIGRIFGDTFPCYLREWRRSPSGR